MAFRMDNYMERWAALYKGIHHTQKAPRFFRCNDEMTFDEFLQNYMRIAEPICGIRTNMEGDMDITKRVLKPVYLLMFLQRADPRDFRNIADVKYRCLSIAEDFLIALEKDQKEAARQATSSALLRLDLGNVRYDTMGPLTSANFYAIFVTIESLEYHKKCYSPSDYYPEEEADWLEHRRD